MTDTYALKKKKNYALQKKIYATLKKNAILKKEKKLCHVTRSV